MRRLLPIKLLALSCLLAACVTVNVYFPAAAAEQAADRIIDTVTSQQQKNNENNPPPKTPPNSRVTPNAGQPMVAHTTGHELQPTLVTAPVRVEQPVLLAAAGALLNLLIPTAEAQGAPNAVGRRRRAAQPPDPSRRGPGQP